jgi:K+-sensing histidine kinase KdpD
MAYPATVVVLSILITITLPPLSQTSSYFLIVGAILFSAWHGGFGPGLFSIFVSTLAIAFYLIDPRHSLTLNSNADLLRLVLFVVVGLGIVLFAANRRVLQARLAQSNEELSRLTARMETV